MPQSPQVKRRETALDRGNARVDRILENIPDLKSFGKVLHEQLLSTETGQVKLGLEVSPGEFETQKADKEEIGDSEYNYSCEEIVIKAGGGPVHEITVQLIS